MLREVNTVSSAACPTSANRMCGSVPRRSTRWKTSTPTRQIRLRSFHPTHQIRLRSFAFSRKSYSETDVLNALRKHIAGALFPRLQYVFRTLSNQNVGAAGYIIDHFGSIYHKPFRRRLHSPTQGSCTHSSAFQKHRNSSAFQTHRNASAFQTHRNGKQLPPWGPRFTACEGTVSSKI